MEIEDYVAAVLGPGWTLEDVAVSYVFQWAGMVLLPYLALAPYLLYLLLGLPLRRKERAQLLLDLLEQGLAEGQSAEQILGSLSQAREPVFGSWLETLEPALNRGESLDRVLAYVPGFLPLSIAAQLQIGAKVGDVRRVLPACRRLLGDARTEVIAAFNYFLLLTFGLVPFSISTTLTIQVWVLPKFREMARDLGVPDGLGSDGIFPYIKTLAVLQLGLLLTLLPLVMNYAAGPELRRRLQLSWFPIWDQLAYWIPWSRKRMKRDFASGLATLLDGGYPEGTAVAEAARCTGNVPFEVRARRVVQQLEQGRSLMVAIRVIDGADELQWRLQNALVGPGGFTAALDGWIARLDALAFRQQQALTQMAVALLLILNGLAVGLIAVSIFGLLVRILDTGLLW